MHAKTTPFLLVWVAVVAAATPVARAMPTPPPPPPRELPTLWVEGDADVEDTTLRVDCDGVRRRARCRLALSFRITALRRVARIVPRLGPEDALEVDGQRVDGPLEVGPNGARVRLEVRRSLRWGLSSGRYLIAEPMFVRHMLLGQGEDIERDGDSVSGALLAGAARVRGGVDIITRMRGRVRLHADGVALAARGWTRRPTLPSLALVLEGAPRTPEWLRHGGPVLGIGSGRDRVFVRFGYELGIGEHLFVEAGVETDFRGRNLTTLTIDAALPSPLYIIPSLSAGLGVVVRGGDERSAAFRLMAGASFVVWGVRVALDVYPGSGEVEPRFFGRISF